MFRVEYLFCAVFSFIILVNTMKSASSLATTASLKSSTNTQKIIFIHWFRHQDLRLHDNPALYETIQASSNSAGKSHGILPIFCFDPRFVSGTTMTPFGSQKCSVRRAQFLLQSVQDLRTNLKQKGSGLVVALGKPEHVFANIIKECEHYCGLEKNLSIQVSCQEEVASEELSVDRAMDKILRRIDIPKSEVHVQGSLVKVWGSTLYHPKDLPFAGGARGIPDIFTPFRTQVEKHCKIGLPLDSPTTTDLALIQDAALLDIFQGTIPQCSLSYMPTLEELGYSREEIDSAQEADPRGVMAFHGGETAALRRVQEYIWDKDLLKVYFDTRNGMLGGDYSTKFSPWLAHGCLSPRYIAKECKRYEKERGIVNKSTYWVVFELLWRDYFKFFALKHGNKIFFLDGTLGTAAHGSHPNSRRWGLDRKSLQAWKEGKTGYPLVDANMRELAATGFMSNRGRQNVASFLAIDMNIDWRYGADHFELQLYDYDVYSNWGNWVSAAGMTGGRLNRFNIVKQSKDYDSEGDYVRHWCPELSNLPTTLVHEPWKMSKDQQQQYGVRLGVDYPNPIVVPNAWNPPKSDDGSDGRKKNGSSNNGHSNRGKGQRKDMKSLKEGKYDFI